MRKPKICLVADVPNWAFDSIAQKLKKELSSIYDIRITYFNRRTEKDYFYEFIEKNDDCDLLHFLNRRILLLMDDDTFKEKVISNGHDLDTYIKTKSNKFTTAVYDYMDIDEEGLKLHKPIFNTYTKMYYVATRKLFNIYSSLGIKKPISMVHDICDDSLFKPSNLDRFSYENIKDRPIVVGWVGNSVHNDEKEVDLKGFRTILKPVIEELQQEGYLINGYYADRNERLRLPIEMNSYYNEIDICICTSIHEGTPRPALEAMYCGVPMISTDVGIIPELFGTLQQEFNIGDRDNGKNDNLVKERLKERLIYLYNNRELFTKLSKENLESIKDFDGGKTIIAFKDFFDKSLKDLTVNISK